MPAICDSISSKLSENLSQSFKKAEKENFENHLAPTTKQVLSAKVEYEPVANYSNTILTTLQTKYIVLQPNQPALSSNGNNSKSQQNNTNGKHHTTTTNGSSTSSLTQLPQPKKTLFARENVQLGWNIGRSWSSGCGFHNVGNTCYLNSALQAFFHVPALAQWLVNDKEHRDRGTCHTYQVCIICAMSQTLLCTQRQQHAITPSLITNRLHNICKHLTLGRQEDAHEFLRYLIEQMEKSFLNRFKGQPGFKDMEQYSKETTPLNQVLGGYLRSTVACLSCKHESITFQHFMDLPLDITRGSTLNEALGGYFARENLEECGYKCESCKKKVSATKRFSLERAPAVLCIQLKRFNVMGGKLNKQIQIVQNLDLQKYLAKSGDQNQNCVYKLVSMVTHLGSSASGGHYTAIGVAPNGNYYHFDDSCVSSIQTENVLKTNAYVLFYEMVNTPKKQNGHSSAVNNNFYQNEHTYSKMASSTSTSSLSTTSRNDFDRSREGFAKPNLPKMIPTSIIRINSQLKQKENETTPPPPSRMVPSTSKSSGLANGNGKVSANIFQVIKQNGKREASDDEDELARARKLRRLTSEEEKNTSLTCPTNQEASPSISAATTPMKPKSLVPYETDDEDEESSSGLSFCRTSSGVFVETDLKENSSPSKHGSTVDKTVVTKASTLNGQIPTVHTNGKTVTNGYHVKRNDDTVQQLTKLNHSGYGSSEVVTWNDTPSNMNREADNNQYDDHKRKLEDEDDMEMDSGRVKKLKYGSRFPNTHQAGKLPNPFQEQQNVHNQNGNFRSNQNSSFYDRPSNSNGYNRNQGYQNGHSNNRNGLNGSKFKGGFKQRDNYNNNNYHNGGGHQNRFGNGGGKFNGNKRHYENNRR